MCPWLFAETLGLVQEIQTQPGVILYANAQIRFVLPAMDTHGNVAVYCGYDGRERQFCWPQTAVATSLHKSLLGDAGTAFGLMIYSLKFAYFFLFASTVNEDNQAPFGIDVVTTSAHPRTKPVLGAQWVSAMMKSRRAAVHAFNVHYLSILHIRVHTTRAAFDDPRIALVSDTDSLGQLNDTLTHFLTQCQSNIKH
eukprot:6053178-Amphidinium_carterae.1